MPIRFAKKQFSKFNNIIKSLVLSNASVEDVAQGFALGMFINFTPLIGFHSILAVGLAALIKRNKVAALIGTWVVNFVTIVPAFYFTYWVGILVVGDKYKVKFNPSNILHMLESGGKVLIPLWTGGVIVGLTSAYGSYYFVKWVYPRLRRRYEKIKTKITHHEEK